jgi:hypothetical protein
MFYKINIFLLLLFFYLIFYNYFVINNLNRDTNRKPLIIKFIIYNETMIKTEILRNNSENFTDFLIPIDEQLNRFEISEQRPMYCNNIDCNFPVFQIGNRYAALNDIPNVIDIFYNYIFNLNNQEIENLKQNIGFNLYQYTNGKLYYNNENYCTLRQGGFEIKKVKRVLPRGERCDVRQSGCTLENNRYYVDTNTTENSFCTNSRNIEVEGNIYCKNNMDINFNGKLCLSIDKYVPIIILNILENKDDYIIEIPDYKPPNIIQFINKTSNENQEEDCPENSSKFTELQTFNEFCQCNSGFSCVGNNCQEDIFSLKTCYNCACNIST